jgi:hypothetical protein
MTAKGDKTMKLYLGHMATFSALAFGALLTATVAGSAPQAAAAPVPTTNRYYYDFEQTLKPWVGVGNALSTSDGMLLQMSGDNACPAQGTSYAVVQTMADAAHNGGAWMVARLNGAGATRVAVAWDARAKGFCRAAGDPCAVEAYVGRVAPTEIDQFEPAGPAFFNWSKHSYATDLPVSESWSSDFYVAVGVRPVGNQPAAPTDFDLGLKGFAIGVDCLQVSLLSGGAVR